MKLKGAHKPSLIILGRTTLALMLVTIAAVSFGAGYFTGYQFTSSGSDDRPVLAAGSRAVLPPDEKRVLEPTPIPAVGTAQSVPPQTPAQGQPAQQIQNQTAQPLISVKPSAPEAAPTPPGKSEPPKVAMAEKPAPAKPAEVKPEEPPKVSAQPQAVPQKPAEVSKKPAVPVAPAKAEAPAKVEKKKAAAQPQAATPKKGGYAVQFGAFAEAPKAEQLRKALLAKGIKAYILPKDKKSSYARVRAGSFVRHDQAVHYAEVCKTKGFAGFVTK